MLTHYAYQGDTTPDSGSSQGKGAFAPFLTKGELDYLPESANAGQRRTKRRYGG